MKHIALSGFGAALALCIGCAGNSASPTPATPPLTLRDLQVLPQDAREYIPPGQAKTPLLDERQQQASAQQLRQAFFKPWQEGPPTYTRPQLLKQFQDFHRGGLYSLNRQERPANWPEGLQTQVHLDDYPNSNRRAITVRNCDLRALPTIEPCFESFDIPGSGYPFDLLQETALWIGTPLRVRHLAASQWAFVESPLANGWIQLQDLAFADEGFVAKWQGLPLAAFIDDEAAIGAPIGTLLPFAGAIGQGLQVLLPVADEKGDATARAATVGRAKACRLPLPATPENLAQIANRMIGRPYGWGGMYQQRDCSSTTHDLLAPFGLWLPRNSAQQAQTGHVMPLKPLPALQREEAILKSGKPWLTLLCCPGHVMLYIGQHDGRAIVFHNFWGLVTRDAARLNSLKSGQTGRYIVGRCVITTLQPGIELPNLALPEGDRRNSIESMNVLGTERENPN